MIVFDYDGFILDVDPDEWASLSIEEQSRRQLIGYFEHAINQKNPDKKSALVGHLENEMYREAAWQVWCELPSHERQVLEALETEFVNEPPTENLGQCSVRKMTLLPDFFKTPNPQIKINPEKIPNFEQALYVVRHELAHAAFRHGETSQIWEMTGQDYRTAYDTRETEAGCVSTIWYGIAMEQWRKGNE